MVTPDEEYDQYVKDPRTACKFGGSCYQKNPLHHQKYKHPPKKRAAEEQSSKATPKKQKLDKEKKKESPKIKISNDISDSDSGSANEAEASPVSQNEQDETEVPVSTKSPDKSEQPKNNSEEPKHNSEEPKNNSEECRSSSVQSPLKELKVSDVPKEYTPVNFDKREFIKEKFLVEMPEDFYMFWDFCKSLNRDSPSDALKSVGLTLVGPYDVFADKFSNVIEKSPEEYLIHWRYYYDPPEFQTVLKGDDSTGYHIGYFRDDPKELPVFLASNLGMKDGELHKMGGNIFAAVCQYLEESKKSCDPFKKLNISKFQGNVKKYAEKINLELYEKTATMKERDKKVLSRTFNKVGLVVPYNRKTQLGYRHLCVSDKELKKLLDRVGTASEQQKDKVMSGLQPVLTATSIATDECDFGTSLELGWDILAHGVEGLNSTIERYLNTAYQLLQKDAFASITSAHMKNRKKETRLSIL